MCGLCWDFRLILWCLFDFCSFGVLVWCLGWWLVVVSFGGSLSFTGLLCLWLCFGLFWAWLTFCCCFVRCLLMGCWLLVGTVGLLYFGLFFFLVGWVSLCFILLLVWFDFIVLMCMVVVVNFGLCWLFCVVGHVVYCWLVFVVGWYWGICLYVLGCWIG